MHRKTSTVCVACTEKLLPVTVRQLGPFQASDQRAHRHEVFYFCEKTLVRVGVMQVLRQLLDLRQHKSRGGSIHSRPLENVKSLALRGCMSPTLDISSSAVSSNPSGIRSFQTMALENSIVSMHVRASCHNNVNDSKRSPACKDKRFVCYHATKHHTHGTDRYQASIPPFEIPAIALTASLRVLVSLVSIAQISYPNCNTIPSMARPIHPSVTNAVLPERGWLLHTVLD